MQKYSPQEEQIYMGRVKPEETISWIEHLQWLGINVEEPIYELEQ